ncbi:MAG: V-type ATP synthase subunit E family protein [Candidatus Hydrothermarchaeota archaeon]|jgi:V/A-type H+-transporting ATPase subunit E|nr:V-type ATP synthase subunit E family protein [Candidatus Hydrothermarchaeota archaeon]
MNAAAKASKITSRIEEDSEVEAQEILRDFQAKADEIIAKTKAQAKSIEDEIIQKGRHDAELINQRIIANAKLQAKKHGLDVKEEIIQNAFDEAEKRLEKITLSKEYQNILKSIIAEGVESIGGDDVEVVVRKEDVKLVNKAFLKELRKKLGVNITLSEDSIKSLGGAIIRTRDGTIVVNNTFETRMRRMRDELRSKVAKILFEE